MVNQKPSDGNYPGISVKGRIIRILREDPETFFSGEFLAKRLGISRVAVWKAVKSLQGAEYPIGAGEKGYTWKQERTLPYNDFLYPWEFGEKESFFHHLTSTDSTMNRAAELAGRGCPGGTVISAGEQTLGRGRNGRPWTSSKGGLFFTLLERPALSAWEYFRVSLALQIAAGRALRELCGKPIQLRWPNDLYAGDKKIAGLLTEFHAEGDRLIWISLGLGVNVNNPPSSWLSCSSLTLHPVSRRDVLLAILKQWEELKKDIFTPKLHKEWNSLALGIGKKVIALEAPGAEAAGRRAFPARGVFMGIDRYGRAIIEGEGRKRFLCSPGNVSIRENQAI